VLQPQGNGEAFDKSFDRCDSEITKGIQYQTLSTNEGQHMARAASQTHENVKDMVINFAKEALADCLNRDLIFKLVSLNYTEDVARRLAPKISFSEGAAQDFATDATAIAALQTAGYLHISQYQGIDSRLGLPPRDLDAQLQDMADEKQAQADQQQQQLEIAKAKIQQPAENQGNQQQKPNNQDNGNKPNE
jgi:phage gp29-like protein